MNELLGYVATLVVGVLVGVILDRLRGDEILGLFRRIRHHTEQTARSATKQVDQSEIANKHLETLAKSTVASDGAEITVSYRGGGAVSWDIENEGPGQALDLELWALVYDGSVSH
jgi:hypothetical protein